MMHKKPFCWAPWTAIKYASTIYEQTRLAPCCEWMGATTNNYFKGSLAEYKDSEWLASVKKQMLTHDMEKINISCKECIMHEKTRGISSRTGHNNRVEDKRFDKEYIQYFYFKPGNICNLKCRMCNPDSSSLIAKELNITSKMSSTDDIIDFDFSKVKVIRLIGGEPSIDPKVRKFIDFLEYKYAVVKNGKKNIPFLLSTSTNCTIANSKWLNRLSKFKFTDVALSIDATGDIIEYIRTGVKWSTLERNIEKLRQVASCYFQITVGIYNFATIEKWFDYFLKFKDVKIYMSPIIEPNYLSLNALPNEIKEEKIEWLSNIDHQYAKEAISMFNEHQFDKTLLDEFQKFTIKKDKLYMTKIQNLDPIFTRLMEWKI